VTLCQRAADAGVKYLSITDHDTCAGYQELPSRANWPVVVIPGVEFSSYWQDTGIHILGLNLNLQSTALQNAVALQQEARRLRAHEIAARLAKHGIENSLPDVERIAGNNYIGRPHFAQYLIDTGRVRNSNEAFRKYLGTGKPGDVKTTWAPMPQIIDWIRAAGGTAVLAHPAKYGLTWVKLSALLDAFLAAGGHGIEVISGAQQSGLTRRLARLSAEKDMLASCGSDFHAPDCKWNEIGRIPDFPPECTPVWDAWNLE
jgi:predicted metal-dependent phosphoesterase TrpH